jgi:hypothetical protein
VFCLAAGYWLAGQWIGILVAILVAPIWLLAQKRPASWLPYICLSLSVVLAVIGTLIGSPVLFMTLGSTVALAVWDLLWLDAALGNDPTTEPSRQYEYKHIRSLLLALGIGLLAILLGHFVTIRLPFIILILLIAFILFAMDRTLGYLKKTGKR